MFKLPSLGYDYGALEPYIDAKTMEVHHTKHHQAYIDNLNKIVEKYDSLKELDIETILRSAGSHQIEEADRQILINNGGGHANHAFFWQTMNPEKQPEEGLGVEIEQVFGSLNLFKEKFTETAMSRFGSGWAWLARDSDGNLRIYSTANQDSPILQAHHPIIGLDVWEHAYYLKYQNRRAEYIENWWKVLKVV